jgi:hypothetical protein
VRRRRRRAPVAGIVSIVLLLAVIWFLRPFWHGFAMFFYTAPLVWLPPLIVLIVGGALIWRRVRGQLRSAPGAGQGDKNLSQWFLGPDGIWRNRAMVWARAAGLVTLVGVTAFVLFVLGGLLQGPLASRALFKDTPYKPIGEIPEGGLVRIVPKEVAERVAGSGFNSPTERLTDFHLVRDGNKLDWTAMRTPDGAVRAFTQKPPGILTLNASTVTRRTRLVDGEFKYAPGIFFFDNLRWKLLKKRFLVELDDPIAIVGDDDRPLIVVPYMQYRGLLIRRPYFGGVFVVHPDGEIEDLEPEEAWKRPELVAAGRLYPEKLTLERQRAYAYKNGLWNKWFLHEDQTQISNTESNPQPYLLDYGRRGFWFVTSAEPYGRAYAVNALFFTNSVTGSMRIWKPPAGADLTGNRRVLETVRSLSIPGIVFADRSGTTGDRGGFRVIEPRPVQVGGQLLFMASIVPDNANQVSKTVFIDAASNRVVKIFDNDTDPAADKKIIAFLASDSVPRALGDTETETDTGGGDSGGGADTGASGSTGPTGRLDDEELRRRLDELAERQRELLDETEQLRDQLER